MTIKNPAIIPPRVDFLDPRTGKIAREWYLYLLNLINLMGDGSGSFADLQTELAFTNDNTSQVADLQWQIDHLELEDSPFSDGNAEVTAVSTRLTGVETGVAFMPNSVQSYVAPPDLPVNASGNTPTRFAWNSRYVAAAYG